MSGARVSKKQNPEFTVYIRFYKKDSQFLSEYKEASRFDMANTKLIKQAIKDATLLRKLMALFKDKTFSLSECMETELLNYANGNSKKRKGGENNNASNTSVSA